jgi:hypothetical protein
MPDFPNPYTWAYKWAAITWALAILVFGAYLKGRHDANKLCDAKEAAAIVLAAEEKARIATEHAQELSKYQEKEKNDEKARTDLAAANAGLRNSIANYRRSAPIAVTSENVCEAGKLFGICAERYESVALRSSELVAECSARYSSMANLAESERGKAELVESLYESIRKRQK